MNETCSVLILASALAAAGLMSACLSGSDNEFDPTETITEPDISNPAVCLEVEEFFQAAIWAPVVSQTCIGCHHINGLAARSRLVLEISSSPGYRENNLARFASLSEMDYQGEPWLIAKPLGLVEHGGGAQFQRDSDVHRAFVDFVAMLREPVPCSTPTTTDEYFHGVRLLDEVQTLRKATIAMLGRMPTDAEKTSVLARGADGLDDALTGIMDEDGFYDFVKETYNDLILTDRYIAGSSAVDLLDNNDYPDRYWFLSIENDAERRLMQQQANTAVAREPLELIAHVIANDLPFAEVLTADYTVTNAFGARSYGVSSEFDDAADPEAFAPVRLPGVPHAGLLTSTMWLNRFPTTDTNRNRHRAATIFDLFLATDVTSLGARPIDPSDLEGFNPTRSDPQCTVCHATIDSIAGLMQNWDARGRYRPPAEGWHPSMFPPGFGASLLAHGERLTAASWLGQQIANDPRFAIATIHTMFQALVGQAPLREPDDSSRPGYDDELIAFEAQAAFFAEVAQAFVESGHDFKTVVRELVASEYFRAVDFASELDDQRARQLHNVAIPRFLTPERLNRKLQAVTGYPWRYRAGHQDHLSVQQYGLFYGGIDSDTVTTRILEPGGIMMSVADLMANDVACLNTMRDFAKPAPERKLFPLVELGHIPQDDDGRPFDLSVSAIRQNIRYLHEHLFGAVPGDDDPDVELTYQLFVEVWRDGVRGLAAGEFTALLPYECQAVREFWTEVPLPPEQRHTQDIAYTGRAWMAVLSHMLSDHRFLYE